MPDMPMTRNDAVEFLKGMDQQPADMNHYLETEAIMKALARRFGEDSEYWGMLGLLHDVDWASTRDDIKGHYLLGQHRGCLAGLLISNSAVPDR